MINTINRVIDWIENVAMTILMFVATIVAIVQVIARYVFSNSLYWSEETILYALIVMSFITASMGVRYGVHISVDFLQVFLGPKLTRFFRFVASLLGVIFAVTLIYYGWRLFVNTNNMGQLSPAMQIPVAYVYLIIPVSGIFMLFRYLGLFQSIVLNKEEQQEDGDKELIVT